MQMVDPLKDDSKTYDSEQTLEDVQRRAEASDCDIIWGAPNRLTLDLDVAKYPTASQVYDDVFKVLQPLYPLRAIDRYTSRGGVGTHVVLQLDGVRLSSLERCGLQAILGSDPMREALCVRRIGNTTFPDPCILFKPRSVR